MPDISYTPISDSIGAYIPPGGQALIRDIWEKDRYLRLARINPGQVVVDIGANVGLFSLQAAHRGAFVLAIEPNPEAFAVLERNIECNGFAKRIRPLNVAVHSHPAGLSGVKLRSVQARGSSLEEILAEALPHRPDIQLLKMDCEGAEWAILESMDEAVSRRIRNLAMETHGGYSEGALVARLKALGFRITGFERRSGLFQTGYAYASRPDLEAGSRPIAGTFAILASPEYAVVGTPSRFDSGSSFALPDGSAAGSREWSIDGKTAGETEAIEHVFREPGVHDVSLRVRTGDQTDASDVGVLVVEKEYLGSGGDAVPLPADQTVLLQVSGEVKCKIPADALPDTWAIGGVMLSIVNARPSFSAKGMRLACNGKTFALNAMYSQTKLAFPSNSLDIVFRLHADSPRSVRVSWWPLPRHSDLDGGAGAIEDLGLMVRLPGPNQEVELSFEGTKEFVIPRTLLPEDWTPRVLKVGVSTLPHLIGSAMRLSGHLEFRQSRHALAGWNSEVALTDYSPEEDIVFSIHAPKAGKWKIVWWGE